MKVTAYQEFQQAILTLRRARVFSEDEACLYLERLVKMAQAEGLESTDTPSEATAERQAVK